MGTDVQPKYIVLETVEDGRADAGAGIGDHRVVVRRGRIILRRLQRVVRNPEEVADGRDVGDGGRLGERLGTGRLIAPEVGQLDGFRSRARVRAGRGKGAGGGRVDTAAAGFRT